MQRRRQEGLLRIVRAQRRLCRRLDLRLRWRHGRPLHRFLLDVRVGKRLHLQGWRRHGVHAVRRGVRSLLLDDGGTRALPRRIDLHRRRPLSGATVTRRAVAAWQRSATRTLLACSPRERRHVEVTPGKLVFCRPNGRIARRPHYRLSAWSSARDGLPRGPRCVPRCGGWCGGWSYCPAKPNGCPALLAEWW